MLASNLNNLDSAAGGFNLSLGRLTEFVSFNRQGFGQISITQDLDTVFELTDQSGNTKGLKIYHTARIKKFQVAEIDKGIDLSAQRRKTTLGQASLQWHLATFETGFNPASGAGILAFVALTGSFSGSRPVTAANAFFTMC
jgi:hypothetical protein